jgi:hypothetical protein
VHVSSLLEHWLDWDKPTRNNNSGSIVGFGADHHSHTAKSRSSPLPGCDCPRRCPHNLQQTSHSSPPSPSSCFGDVLSTHLLRRAASIESGAAYSSSSEEDSGEESDSDAASVPCNAAAAAAAASGEEQEKWIRQICENGCDDINRTDEEGKTILQYLLEGEEEGENFVRPNVSLSLKFFSRMLMFTFSSSSGNGVKIYGNSLVDCTRLLLNTGADPNAMDSRGNTALLYVQHLLSRGLFSEAAKIAQIMLEKMMTTKLKGSDGSGINSVDASNRTLLSHSVAHGDQATDLTRMLLNFGAKVLPSEAVAATLLSATSSSSPLSKEDDENIVRELTKERDQSAFTSFLRAAMRRQTLEGAEATLDLLCHAMGEDPTRMRSHVPRTMLELGKGASVNGPLFIKLKETMAPFWSRPQSLKYQCLKRIRRSMGPKRLNNRGCVERLRLPPKLQKAVLLEEASVYACTTRRS